MSKERVCFRLIVDVVVVVPVKKCGQKKNLNHNLIEKTNKTGFIYFFDPPNPPPALTLK